MIIRVVLDTNVYISALIFGGVPHSAFMLASTRPYELCISTPILIEVRRTLTDRFNHSPGEAERTGRRLQELCQFIIPAEVVSACTDPDDDRVLECAVAAEASIIVTGDRALLRLDPFRGVRIVTPAQFLELAE